MFSRWMLGGVSVLVIGSAQLFAKPAEPTDRSAADLAAPMSLEAFNRLVDQATDDVTYLQRRQAKARSSPDPKQLPCVNDALVQAKPLLDALKTIDGHALTPESSEAARKNAEDIRKLREDGDVCVGDFDALLDINSSYRPEGIDDPRGSNPFDIEPIEIPAYASPFT